MAELSRLQDQIRALNTKLVLVHLASPETGEAFFHRYGLWHADVVSDPEARLYRHFGLVKGRMSQMLGLRIWLRSLDAGVIRGHGLGGRIIGDGFQMPGVFLLFRGDIRDQFIHSSIADKPNYLRLALCPESSSSEED